MKSASNEARNVVKIRQQFEGGDRLHMAVKRIPDQGFIIPIDRKNGAIVPQELLRHLSARKVMRRPSSMVEL